MALLTAGYGPGLGAALAQVGLMDAKKPEQDLTKLQILGRVIGAYFMLVEFCGLNTNILIVNINVY